jgi:hypothetical protein
MYRYYLKAKCSCLRRYDNDMQLSRESRNSFGRVGYVLTSIANYLPGSHEIAFNSMKILK